MGTPPTLLLKTLPPPLPPMPLPMGGDTGDKGATGGAVREEEGDSGGTGPLAGAMIGVPNPAAPIAEPRLLACACACAATRSWNDSNESTVARAVMLLLTLCPSRRRKSAKLARWGTAGADCATTDPRVPNDDDEGACSAPPRMGEPGGDTEALGPEAALVWAAAAGGGRYPAGRGGGPCMGKRGLCSGDRGAGLAGAATLDGAFAVVATPAAGIDGNTGDAGSSTVPTSTCISSMGPFALAVLQEEGNAKEATGRGRPNKLASREGNTGNTSAGAPSPSPSPLPLPWPSSSRRTAGYANSLGAPMGSPSADGGGASMILLPFVEVSSRNGVGKLEAAMPTRLRIAWARLRFRASNMASSK